VAAHNLLADLALRPHPKHAGVYQAELGNAWSFLMPSGGMLMSLALAAMERHLGDEGQKVVSANAIFCEALPEGPVNVTVTLLRRGKAASQLRARLQEGAEPDDSRPGLEVSATFAKDREGPDLKDARFPSEVARWEDSRPAPEHHYPVPFLDNFEDRLALGHLRTGEEWPVGPGRYARWLRFLLPPRLADGRLSPLALPPIADLMPPALLQMLGSTAPRFLAPSLDLTIHFLEPTTADRVLVYSRCRRAQHGYATADVELFDPDGRILAFGTQVMMIRRWPTELQG
jgi:acyl-CoA thioesterase